MGGRVVVVESRFDPLQVNVLPLNLSGEGGDEGMWVSLQPQSCILL